MKELENLEKMLSEALGLWKEMELLDGRVRGSYMYPKKIRPLMQEKLLVELQEKSTRYKALKEKYELAFKKFQIQCQKSQKQTSKKNSSVGA